MFINVLPGDENAIEAVIAVSDFIILPIRFTAADLSCVWELRNAASTAVRVNMHKRKEILLQAVNKRRSVQGQGTRGR